MVSGKIFHRYRLQNDIILGPFGSGAANDNSDRMLSFRRRHRLLISGLWFRRKDIHQYSWYSNDGNTRKEINHILVETRWKSIANCQVFRSLEFPSDHRPVVAQIKLHLKRHQPASLSLGRKFSSSALKDMPTAVQFQRALLVGFVLSPLMLDEVTPVESIWNRFRELLFNAAFDIIPPVRPPKTDWILVMTRIIVNRRREARGSGNMELYHTLNHVRRRLIRHDRQELANKLASDGEDFWNRNRPHVALKKFRHLRSSAPRVSAPIKSAIGELLTELPRKLERWRQYFKELLKSSSSNTVAFDSSRSYRCNALSLGGV